MPPLDSQALANAISRLISDPEFAQTIAANARKVVMERFSLEQHVQAIQDIYAAAIQTDRYNT